MAHPPDLCFVLGRARLLFMLSPSAPATKQRFGARCTLAKILAAGPFIIHNCGFLLCVDDGIVLAAHTQV